LNWEATPTTIRLSRPISISGLFSQKEAKVVTLNGTIWTMIVHKTQIANRGRPIEWSSCCRWVAPPTANFASGHFSQPESANNSKTMRAGRKMSKEHLQQSWVSLSTGHVTSARWRHLLLISALGAFRDFQKR
jgi:hypothetical protein